MKYIQVVEIGRGARELNHYAAVVSDPLVLLALEIEKYWQDGAIINPVPGEQNSYAILRKPSLIGGKRVIKVRIIDVEADEDTKHELKAVS